MIGVALIARVADRPPRFMSVIDESQGTPLGITNDSSVGDNEVIAVGLPATDSWMPFRKFVPCTFTLAAGAGEGGTTDVIVGAGSATTRSSIAFVAATVACGSTNMSPCSVASSTNGTPGIARLHGAGGAETPPRPNESASNSVGADENGAGTKHSDEFSCSGTSVP